MKKYWTAMVGALVLSTVGFASPALAVTPSFDEQPAGNSTLTVTLPETNPNNDVPGPIRDGYTVEVSRVDGVDITTKDGYNRATALTLDDVEQLGSTAAATSVTDTNGSAVFIGLEPALYRVAATAPEGRTHTMDISPVLVVLPGANDQGQWAYAVTLMLKQQPPKPPVPPEDIPNPSPTPPPAPPATTPAPELPLTGSSAAGLTGLAGLLLLAGCAVLTRARGERK